MIVAPNSPSARAHAITMPAASAGAASGSVIQRMTLGSAAPSTRAASSSSRSTPAMPARADRMKNGAATKTWASTTAATVNGSETPRSASGSPSRPRRPKTSSSARPATEGGMTMGRSTRVSTSARPRPRPRARRRATGVPKTTTRPRLKRVLNRLSVSASATAGEANASTTPPSRMERPTSTPTGRPRKATAITARAAVAARQPSGSLKVRGRSQSRR